ncbi:unnamed protein product [Didymodactylos carnosus]|uniref:Uncharacterized protein n=1 Tax=Didymodactylos carnosus TaxID=1234261 RepID=A0A8S2CUH6_9BILA|nr:unnamed protein product [Didymodactylos carnosus]CAF3589204.1 unnamed protein product [Didymodactylos carnosus]
MLVPMDAQPFVMCEAILKNFLLNYPMVLWDSTVLEKLQTLFNTSTSCSTLDFKNECILVLLLHVSKFDISFELLQELIDNTSEIKIMNFCDASARLLNIDLNQLFLTVSKTTRIIKLIETMWYPLTQSMFDVNEYYSWISSIKIHFIKVPVAFNIRGHCGRTSIYINFNYFYHNYVLDKDDAEHYRELLSLDLITLCLYEFIHEIVRLKMNNVNFSTPHDSSSNIKEAGREIEKLLFNCCPDWNKIYKRQLLKINAVRNIYTTLLNDEEFVLPSIPDSLCRTSIYSGIDASQSSLIDVVYDI